MLSCEELENGVNGADESFRNLCYPFSASMTSAMNCSWSQAFSTTLKPSLTITSFFEGMMATYCPSKPRSEYISGGTFGIQRSSGSPDLPAFNQNWAPYSPFGALGVGVV